MVNEGALEGLGQTDLALSNQFRDNFRVMINFEVTAEVRIIFLQSVVAVRTNSDNLLTP